MDLLTIFGWILAILLFITAYWYLTVPKNLPPGPAGLPILGYIPFADPNLHLFYTKLAKKYGNIFHLYFGSTLAVILNDIVSIKEAFIKQGEIFSGRHRDPDISEIVGEFPGIVTSDGEYWRQHRRFLLHNLRDSGVGKAAIEPQLLDEIQHFLKRIREQNGADIDIKKYLSPSVANNIQILVTGKRFDYEHPTLQAIFRSIKDFTDVINILPMTMFFPWTKPIIDSLFPSRRKLLSKYAESMLSVISSALSEVKSKYVDGQNENYLQAYLTERNRRLEVNNDEKTFTEHGLIVNTQDLLIAGTDTSSSTLAWAALYMALHPDVQKRVQREIDDVIGRHREPSYADRINTPYTEATINELHRAISLINVGVPHRANQDTTLNGYHIPKDTIVISNIWAVHHDVTLWGDPENFRPERFIGPKGECLRPEYLIPFSIGKRACAGEPLARMELYLYFVSLLQNFNFVPPEGVKITLEAEPGFTRQAKSYIVSAKPRL